ncbi:MAG: heavy metal translocating P-type ATPase [Verrucomicrobiia bacterium]
MHAPKRSEPIPQETACLARSVADALKREPGLEAITIDLARKEIAVATLGRVSDAGLHDRIAGTVREAQSAAGHQGCCLIRGEGDCDSCDAPLSVEEDGEIRVEREGDSMTIARVTCPTAPSFWRWRRVPWPRVVQRDVEFLESAEDVDEWKPQLLAAGLCGLSGIVGYALEGSAWSGWAYVLAYLAGGWFTAQEVWERLRKATIDVHLLMLAVAAGSASIGAWGEGAMLLFLFSLSGALEHYALGRTQREIHSLFRDAPKVAAVIDESGKQREVPVERLRTGMRLLIRPDSQFPVDAEIVKGQTAADESNLTGEAAPVEKRVGDPVFSGTLNLWGAVEATVLRPATESALQKIIRLIKEAQRQKAPTQQFADKFGAWYTYVVLGLSLVMFFVWWLGFQLPPFTRSDAHQSAFYRTMTLLVVASPCALVLSIPSAVLAAIARGARSGVLFRGGAAVEKLSGITLVALDKTGTLTTGELRVERVESFPPGREQEIARLAYSLERLSNHPLARAVTRYGKQQGLVPVEFDHFESVAGQGLRGVCGAETCTVGKREWLAQLFPPDFLTQVPASEVGVSEIWLAKGNLVGRIVLRDDLRPEAQQVIQELRKEGLQTVVLTGDRQAAAQHLKERLGLNDVRAELRPEQKVAAIQALASQKHRVAMVGDGVNDAPSLAAASVGVAMGARGADAALEQADVVLMHDRIENFLAAFRLSQQARRVIRQNLVISLGTVLVLVCFALLGKIPLTAGVIGHEGSTVVVVMNSLRLLLGRLR